MYDYQKQNFKIYQKGKHIIKKTEQAQEPDMARMLQLSDREFKAAIINMLRVQMEVVDSTQEQLVNEMRDMKILVRTKTKYWRQKHCNLYEECPYGLISRQYMNEERNSE